MDSKPATSATSAVSSSQDVIQRKRQQSDDVSCVQKGKSSSFEQFNVVGSYSGHHFAANILKPSNAWTKKIQQEWKILEKNLPETIFVRVCEERMDLLRAVIIGPAGTPYHDGLFFFDFQFTADYPNEPPRAYYHSGGLRLNPNLYSNGTVCLSLLSTWLGKGCEKWDPKRSTMLQILVSIQGLVLNDNPYFNEPVFAWTSNSRKGKKSAFDYNESTFLLSCRTMVYSLQKPPQHFEDIVADHFQKHGSKILRACRAYLNGVQVGHAVGEIVDTKGCSENFKAKVKKMTDELHREFTAKGIDCSDFLLMREADAASAKRDLSSQRVKAVEASAQPKESKNSKLKQFGQFLLKLGKKVLPIDN